MQFDETDFAPAFYAVSVQGEHDEEPRVYEPLAHSSGEAMSRVMEFFDTSGVVLVGQFRFSAKATKRVGGYDSPMIAAKMRRRTTIHTKDGD